MYIGFARNASHLRPQTDAIKSCTEARDREYFSHPMDKFISICAMPIGVLICFGPALVIWVIAELKDPSQDASDKK